MASLRTDYLSLDGGRRSLNALSLVAFVSCAVSIACSIYTSSAVATLAPAKPSALYSEDRGRHGRDWEEEFRHMYRPSGEAAPPSKFALPLITPMQNQKQRGSCWVFSIAGVLEHSYRKFAVDNGWFDPDEYLRLSEQGIGAAIVRACRKLPEVCKTGDGDSAYTGNSTEGGEPEWLYYMQRYISDTVALPWSVCPYNPKHSINDTVCADEKLLEASPLSLRVASLHTYYELSEMKEALVKHGRAMGFSFAFFNRAYRLPCTGEMHPLLGRCDPDKAQCVPCPLEPNFENVECCVQMSRTGSSMHGEFYGGRTPDSDYSQEGGHAVLLVGYNDNYVSPTGMVGGLIVKNSWKDGVGAGSHTIDYLMQRHSPIAERKVCPNVHLPDSWYPCGSLHECSSEKVRISAKAMHKILRLECNNGFGFAGEGKEKICDDGDEYFFKNVTKFGGGLSVSCFIAARDGADLCLPPMWYEDLTLLFSPVEEEKRENDADQCGFYFFPYESFRSIAATQDTPWATDLDVHWDLGSFANAPRHYRRHGKDYSLLEKDTLRQRRDDFAGPFPRLVRPL